MSFDAGTLACFLCYITSGLIGCVPEKTDQPSSSPSPSEAPSSHPSLIPSSQPTTTSKPSFSPSISFEPTISHSPSFSFIPSMFPSVSNVPSSEPSDASSTAPSTKPEPFVKIGVYYYPWHGVDFHGGEYLREFISPPQLPALGEYDDREESVISQHLSWSKQAHISLWAVSWWGPDRRSDRIMQENILPYLERNNEDIRIAIHYETKGRTLQFTSLENIEPDMNYLAENYFSHPNYYKINNRPVVVVYLTRSMSKEDDQTMINNFISTMRSAASNSGYSIYIIADEVFGKAIKARPAIKLYDAITCYDVYGSTRAKGYAGQAIIDEWFDEQEKWRDVAQAEGVAFIPAVTPGFNDKGVRDGNEPLSRQLDIDSEHGSLFSALLEQAVDLVDEAGERLMLVTSFNEWHEDTQIEPVSVSGPTSKDISVSGEAYTTGLSYEGYGTKYLDILASSTTIIPKNRRK